VERLRGLPWRSLRGLGPALDAPLAEVLGGSPAERVLDRFLRSRRDLSAAQRAAAAEAVFGVGLWRRRLAFHLGAAGPAPRRMLAALLRDLGGVPEAEALVDLPPGELPPPRPPPTDLAERFSLPDWLAAEVGRAAGPQAARLADALDAPGPVCLRANRLRIGPAELADRLGREGVATRPGQWARDCLVVISPRPNLYGLASHRAGLFEVQDEGSQLLGELVGAEPGEEVLDLCAGAGGKTLQLAAAAGERGRVHAADPDAGRLERLRRRAVRAGAAGVVVHGAEPPPALEVDRALVDAPCSELGALRRGPDLRFRLDPATFAPLSTLQRSLLARAARSVRRGGRLVYATCTFRREENEEAALAFEAAHPDFGRVRPAAPEAFAAPDGFFRAWPHRHGTDGFFAAVWERRSSRG
jgi:16S rRNA (cytosine967-C5)-methyltransferase